MIYYNFATLEHPLQHNEDPIQVTYEGTTGLITRFEVAPEYLIRKLTSEESAAYVAAEEERRKLEDPEFAAAMAKILKGV